MNKNDKIIYFDVMVNDKFIMQIDYKYCPLFPININDVVNKVIKKRPTLKGKKIILYETKEIVNY